MNRNNYTIHNNSIECWQADIYDKKQKFCIKNYRGNYKKIGKSALVFILLNTLSFGNTNKNYIEQVILNENFYKRYEELLEKTNRSIKNADNFFVNISKKEIKEFLSEIEKYEKKLEENSAKKNKEIDEIKVIKENLQEKVEILDGLAGATEKYRKDLKKQKTKKEIIN